MFIRPAWAKRPGAAAEPRSLRRLPCVPRRGCDDFGLPARDFDKMIKGLFDRQD